VLFIVVVGCSDGGAAAPPSTAEVVETTTTTVPPTTGPLPAAADGTNLAACSDGRCEVLIAPGDKITFTGDVVGFEQLTIDNIDATGVYTRGTGPGINLTLGEETPGTPYTMNRLVMSVIGFNQGQAVLRMAPVA
jgi:hypothetical protein